jgi:endonuclease/exonuclease/phosphatase family metal-dependent hydrolase
MAFARAVPAALGDEVCVANLHASAGERLRATAEREVLRAAEHAVEWAGDTPLLLGGDFNLRPEETGVFEQLADRYGFSAPTKGLLDHLLVRGLEVAEPVVPWPPQRREVAEDGLAMRLSDHAPVAATLRN